MNRYLSRKSFVTTLGAAGLGLGLTAGTFAAAPSAMAQDTAETPDEGPADEFADFREKRVELYNAFTAALAEELDVASADEVDGAIRIALMAVIDDHVGDDGLAAGQAEAMKALVATSDVPIPAMAFGGGPGMFIARGHGHGFGMGGEHMMPGRGRITIREAISEQHQAAHAEDGDASQGEDDE